MNRVWPNRLQARQLARAAIGIAVVSALCAPNEARARSAGVAAAGCDNCHSGGKTPTVTLTADPPNPGVGQAVTLTVGVSQTNGSAAGFYLTTAYDSPGAFKAVESGTAWAGSGVLHTMPRVGSGGVTNFKVQWTASQATGVAFDVYALSANSDKTNRGDGPGLAHLKLAVGCTGTTYYIDQDSDGYGSTDPAYATRVDCAQPPGYAAMPGDCDDFRAQVHPGAIEQCDLKDNDCNGEVDDNVVSQAFCEDADGDGHGAVGGATMTDCKPNPGFADCDADCDDRDASIHPGATEICDGRDNNCNGKFDEGARMACGVGLCARYAVGCSNNCTPGEPFTETCDGFDDDCDGEVDEGTNETLCGDSNVVCVQGKCMGDPSSSAAAGTGSIPGGGAAAAVGAGPSSGLAPTSGSGGGCVFSVGGGRDWAVWWLPLAAALLRLLSRRREQGVDARERSAR